MRQNAAVCLPSIMTKEGMRQMTSRELVYATLSFQNKSGRAPRHLWVLPWADNHYPDELREIRQSFPDDISYACTVLREQPVTVGKQFSVGTYVDEWNCTFENIQEGVVGEVKHPLVPAEDEDWADVSRIHVPEEWLTFDMDEVNRSCAESDRFMLSGCCPRPFEQLQYIRGTENLYMDLMFPPEGLKEFMKRMHDFY